MIAALIRLLHGSNHDRIHGFAGSQSVSTVVQTKCCLVRFPLDIQHHVFDFCTLRDVVYIDSAMTNRSHRKHFLMSLQGFKLRGPANFMFVKWFRTRRCFMAKLVVTSPIEDIATVRSIDKISELTIRGAADVSAVHMFYFLAECENLERLDIGDFPRFQVSHLNLLSRPLNLLALHLSRNSCIDNVTVVALLAKCPHLQVLHANDCAQLSEPVLRAVTQHCPQLQEIHFNWCKERAIVRFDFGAPHTHITYDPNSCYSQLFRACKQLKIIDFSTHEFGYYGGNITPLDVLTLGQNFTQLTHVCLSATQMMYTQRDRTNQLEVALTLLVQANPHIVSLALEHFQRISNAALDAIAANLPNLQSFALKQCGLGGQVGKEGLLNIRTRCVKLTTFDVRDISYLAQGKPGMLQRLNLGDYWDESINDATLMRIAEHNYNMQTFCSSHRCLKRLTSVGFCVALSHWHNLRTIVATGDFGVSNSTLYGVPINAASDIQVVDNSVLYTITQNCPLLTTLDISGNTKLSNEALCEIAKLVHLQHLKARYCKLMLDSAFNAIALACQCLVHIEISRCNITDTAIRALARYGSQKLQHITICECPRLHNSSIRLLIRASRQLRVLRLSCYSAYSGMSFRAVAQLPLYCPYMETLDVGLMWHYFCWSYRQNRQYFDAILFKSKLWYIPY